MDLLIVIWETGDKEQKWPQQIVWNPICRHHPGIATHWCLPLLLKMQSNHLCNLEAPPYSLSTLRKNCHFFILIQHVVKMNANTRSKDTHKQDVFNLCNKLLLRRLIVSTTRPFQLTFSNKYRLKSLFELALNKNK